MPLLKKTQRYKVSKKSDFIQAVELLDSSRIECTLTVESTVRECLDNVLQRVEVKETEYFGLRYINKKGQFRWLDPEKSLRRQLKSCETSLVFVGVRFFVENIFAIKDEAARYQIFLQLKNHISVGRMVASMEQYIQLASYSLQAVFGDYDFARQNTEYVREIDRAHSLLLPKTSTGDLDESQLADLTQHIVAEHMRLAGYSQAYAEILYVRLSERTDGYGVEYHQARAEDGQCVFIGLSHRGAVIRRPDGHPLCSLRWLDISQLTHNRKQFIIVIAKQKKSVLKYSLEDVEMVRYLCHIAEEQLEFHTVKHISIMRAPEVEKELALFRVSKMPDIQQTTWRVDNQSDIERPIDVCNYSVDGSPSTAGHAHQLSSLSAGSIRSGTSSMIPPDVTQKMDPTGPRFESRGDTHTPPHYPPVYAVPVTASGQPPRSGTSSPFYTPPSHLSRGQTVPSSQSSDVTVANRPQLPSVIPSGTSNGGYVGLRSHQGEIPGALQQQQHQLQLQLQQQQFQQQQQQLEQQLLLQQQQQQQQRAVSLTGIDQQQNGDTSFKNELPSTGSSNALSRLRMVGSNEVFTDQRLENGRPNGVMSATVSAASLDVEGRARSQTYSMGQQPGEGQMLGDGLIGGMTPFSDGSTTTSSIPTGLAGSGEVCSSKGSTGGVGSHQQLYESLSYAEKMSLENLVAYGAGFGEQGLTGPQMPGSTGDINGSGHALHQLQQQELQLQQQQQQLQQQYLSHQSIEENRDRNGSASALSLLQHQELQLQQQQQPDFHLQQQFMLHNHLETNADGNGSANALNLHHQELQHQQQLHYLSQQSIESSGEARGSSRAINQLQQQQDLQLQLQQQGLQLQQDVQLQQQQDMQLHMQQQDLHLQQQFQYVSHPSLENSADMHGSAHALNQLQKQQEEIQQKQHELHLQQQQLQQQELELQQQQQQHLQQYLSCVSVESSGAGSGVPQTNGSLGGSLNVLAAGGYVLHSSQGDLGGSGLIQYDSSQAINRRLSEEAQQGDVDGELVSSPGMLGPPPVLFHAHEHLNLDQGESSGAGGDMGVPLYRPSPDYESVMQQRAAARGFGGNPTRRRGSGASATPGSPGVAGLLRTGGVVGSDEILSMSQPDISETEPLYANIQQCLLAGQSSATSSRSLSQSTGLGDSAARLAGAGQPSGFVDMTAGHAGLIQAVGLGDSAARLANIGQSAAFVDSAAGRLAGSIPGHDFGSSHGLDASGQFGSRAHVDISGINTNRIPGVAPTPTRPVDRASSLIVHNTYSHAPPIIGMMGVGRGAGVAGGSDTFLHRSQQARAAVAVASDAQISQMLLRSYKPPPPYHQTSSPNLTAVSASSAPSLLLPLSQGGERGSGVLSAASGGESPSLLDLHADDVADIEFGAVTAASMEPPSPSPAVVAAAIGQGQYRSFGNLAVNNGDEPYNNPTNNNDSSRGDVAGAGDGYCRGDGTYGAEDDSDDDDLSSNGTFRELGSDGEDQRFFSDSDGRDESTLGRAVGSLRGKGVSPHRASQPLPVSSLALSTNSSQGSGSIFKQSAGSVNSNREGLTGSQQISVAGETGSLKQVAASRDANGSIPSVTGAAAAAALTEDMQGLSLVTPSFSSSSLSERKEDRTNTGRTEQSRDTHESEYKTIRVRPEVGSKESREEERRSTRPPSLDPLPLDESGTDTDEPDKPTQINRSTIFNLTKRAPKDDRRKYFQEKLAHSQVFIEYERIPRKRVEADYEAALKEENTKRNRFCSVLPYEDTRVTITPYKENSLGYVNASHVRMEIGQQKLHYIATQNPLDATVGDFWQMIWEQGALIVAMVTDTEKCPQYWPTRSGSKKATHHWDLTISLQTSTKSGSYTASCLKVRHQLSKETRTIWHLQFTEWPEKGVPDSVYGFLTYLDELISVRLHLQRETDRLTPVVVHCSAGVGRSGVLILCDIMRKCLEQNSNLEMCQVISHIRHQRMYLVKTAAQYEFAHQVLAEYLQGSRLI